MSGGGRPAFVDFFLPGENIWIPLEKAFFLFGTSRSILLNLDSPLIRTKYYFSVPPFYFESSASPGRINGVVFPPFYTELHASSPFPVTVRYVLGNAGVSPPIPFP